MQEDCLYLSVFTPQPNRTDLPVMVWLPQGGFISDATPLFQPEFLLAKDVVLVVLQHRLGVLGFLSTEDAELPGNLGLKDQAMAPAGCRTTSATSAETQTRSPSSARTRGARLCTTTCCLPCPVASSSEPSCSRGRRCVPGRSGRTTGRWPSASAAWWAVRATRGRRQQHGARRLPQGRPRRAADGRDALHHALPVRPDAPRGRRVPARPPRHAGQGRPLQPRRRPLRRDAGRGAFNARAFVEDGVMDSMIQNFSLVGPPALGFEAWDDDPEYLARLAFHRYLGPMEFDLTRIDPLVKLLGDSFYSMCHVEAVEHHARDAAFGFRALRLRAAAPRGARLLRPVPGPSPAWNLAYVGDSDDLQYLFSFDKLNVSLTKEEDLFVSRIMVDLWTNFAATGNPTPDLSLGFKWTPTEASSLLPRHHLRPRHEGLRQGAGHRILEEPAEEDEQAAVPGPLLPEQQLGRLFLRFRAL
nr:uncharacterized protein LOC113814476 [Penaeus vannamei]